MQVDYEPLPAVSDARTGEVAFEIGLGDAKEKVDGALAKAAHVTRLELWNNRLVANPIEPRAALAEHTTRRAGRSTRPAKARTTSTARLPIR